MSNGIVQHLLTDPAPQRAPIDLPKPVNPGLPREAPEPSTPDDPAVDPEEAHVGATEEQIGDRTGPGVGYDQGEKPK